MPGGLLTVDELDDAREVGRAANADGVLLRSGTALDFVEAVDTSRSNRYGRAFRDVGSLRIEVDGEGAVIVDVKGAGGDETGQGRDEKSESVHSSARCCLMLRSTDCE